MPGRRRSPCSSSKPARCGMQRITRPCTPPAAGARSCYCRCSERQPPLAPPPSTRALRAASWPPHPSQGPGGCCGPHHLHGSIHGRDRRRQDLCASCGRRHSHVSHHPPARITAHPQQLPPAPAVQAAWQQPMAVAPQGKCCVLACVQRQQQQLHRRRAALQPCLPSACLWQLVAPWGLRGSSW